MPCRLVFDAGLLTPGLQLATLPPGMRDGHHCSHSSNRRFAGWLCVLFLFLARQQPLRAAVDIDAEFEFAAKLIEAKFPECAVYLAERLVKDRPEEQDRANVIRAEALISQRKLEAATQILANMAASGVKAQAIKLALADGYYQVGKLDKCTAIYSEFFNSYGDKVPTDPDLLRFFRLSAHKFAQMLARKGEASQAARVYDLVVKTVTNRGTKRQVLVEQAELLAKAAATAQPAAAKTLLEQADGNCSEVIWGGMDLWFGRAVTCLARTTAVRGEPEEAMKLLSANLEMLKTLDDLLEEANIPLSESPFAAARSLLGSLYRDEADLLLSAKQRRELRAVGYLEEAFGDLKGVWNIIVRTHKRDEAIVKRNDDDRSVLQGNRAERQKPFDEITAGLAEFDKAVREGNSESWTEGARGRVDALAKNLAALRGEVRKYPKKMGVTRRSEMTMHESFKGKRRTARALSLLGSQGARRKAAADFYIRSLRHYYNVFAGYPGSTWSSEAGEVVEMLKERLHALTGQEVQIKARDRGLRKIALVKLHEGSNLFSRKEYAKAVREYLAGLNEYPEGPESLVGLANLMECYANLNDELRVKVLAHYLAERFNERPSAPQALLRQGRYYFEKKNSVMYKAIYETYLAGFPDHHSAPTILYMLGEQHWTAEDYDGSVSYYQRLVDTYAKSGYFAKALNRIGWASYLKKDYGAAVKVFQRIVDEGRPGWQQARGKLCLADSSRLMGSFKAAVRHYRDLAKWLTAKNSAYRRDAASKDKSRELQDMLEQAVFFQAYCLSRIDSPEKRLPDYRAAAVKLYNALATRFPSSPLAPTALSSMGAVLLIDGKSEEAAKAYDELARRFPESEAGQNARFAMIKSLLDVDEIVKAKEVFAEMAADAAAYPVEHFLRTGELLLQKEEYLSALRAYRIVSAALKDVADMSPEQQAMDQRALFGIGRALIATEEHEEAVTVLSDLIELYPTSGLFYEARFLIAGAYEELERADEAIEILRDIFDRARDQGMITRATVSLARLQLARGEADAALASCQRIVLLGDPNSPAVRPFYETALQMSVTLLGQAEKWKDVKENADRYISLFPSGPGINEIRKWQTRARTSTVGDDGRVEGGEEGG